MTSRKREGEDTYQKPNPKTQLHPSNPYVHPVVFLGKRNFSSNRNISKLSLIHNIPLLFQLYDVDLVGLRLYRMFLGLKGGGLRIGMIH